MIASDPNQINPQTLDRFASFVGVDLHKKVVALAAVDRQGNILDRIRCSTQEPHKIHRFLRGLPRPLWMAVEAVGFIEWFIDEFRPAVERIDIADATKLASMRGKRRKNDRKDSLEFAQRLARGECPLGYIADEDLLHLRKLGRHWHRLSERLSRAKTTVRSLLNAANLEGPTSNSLHMRQWLELQGHQLKPATLLTIEGLTQEIEGIEHQRRSLEEAIRQANTSDVFAADIQLLKTVKGIGDILACIIRAEVGPFMRFPNADALEFWSGLTPDNQESAGRTQSGHITKAGPASLRWALGQAAMAQCRSDRRVGGIRRKLANKRGKGKANTAMARRLLRTLYAMMRDGVPYDPKANTGGTRPAKAQATRPHKDKPTARQRADAFFASRPPTGAKGERAKNAYQRSCSC
ncbi:MAG: IS110 family transposase [Phycisphaerae bacterium]|nr:IS110 family transposase [Phycisphaerae bacterium]